MLRIYDQSHAFVGYITKYKDCQIDSDISTGDKTIMFTVLEECDVANEYYIRTDTDEYVVKEIEQDSGGSPSVVAMLNLEALQGKSWQSFSVTDTTIDAAARLALAGTGWTVGTCDVTKRRNASMPKVTSLTVIQNLCTVFMCEPVFDTIAQKVSFYETRGEDKGAYFIAGLNLRKITKKSDSNGFFTQIIPIGADGLTINAVNGGKNYLENHQYSDKVIQFIWEDESYTDAQALKDDAEAYLSDKSKPAVSYSADIIDLAAQHPEYSILSYQLGDTIRLIDRSTWTQDVQRIVKMTEYPLEPEKNTCEIANTFLTFEELQAKLQAAASLVGDTMTSDGKIHVSDILNWEKGLAESPLVGGIQDSVTGLGGQLTGLSGTVSGLSSDLSTLSGQLGALSLTVGSIETNYLKVEDAEIKYAHIDLANIKDGCITNAMIGVGVVESAQIADGAITNLKVAGDLDATKITAGTLSVDRLVIRGSNKSLVYELNNISGALQAKQVDTLNGEIITDRTIIANKIVASSITGNEIEAKTINANHIVANSITAAEIAAGAIKADEIDAGAVTAVKIAANAVTADKIATDAIKSRNYSAGTETNFSAAGTFLDLSNGLIKSKNFGIDASGNAYIRGNITATSGTIGGCTITNNQLTVPAANITGQLTAGQISAGAITAEKIAADAVTAEKIKAGAVTADELAAGAITTEKLAANAVTAAKINVGDLFAQDITASGTIRGVKLVGASLESTNDNFKTTINGANIVFYSGSTLIGAIMPTFFSKSVQSKGVSILTNSGFFGLGKIYENDIGKYTYSYTYNNGANPNGYTEEHIFSGNMRLVSGNLILDGTITEAGTLLSSKYAAISHGHTGYAASSHTHTGYAASSHTHTGYAASGHTHSLSSLGAAASSHTHTGYAASGHTHSSITGDSDTVTMSKVDGVFALHPNSTNGKTCSLGTSGHKFFTVFAMNGTIQTSDRTTKNSITPISPRYEQLFACLKPVTYRFNRGDRVHTGFVSQDIEEALAQTGLTAMDWAAFCKDTSDKGAAYSLRYSEIIALNTHMIQKLMARIVQLEQQINQISYTGR